MHAVRSQEAAHVEDIDFRGSGGLPSSPPRTPSSVAACPKTAKRGTIPSFSCNAADASNQEEKAVDWCKKLEMQLAEHRVLTVKSQTREATVQRNYHDLAKIVAGELKGVEALRCELERSQKELNDLTFSVKRVEELQAINTRLLAENQKLTGDRAASDTAQSIFRAHAEQAARTLVETQRSLHSSNEKVDELKRQIHFLESQSTETSNKQRLEIRRLTSDLLSTANARHALQEKIR